MPYKKLIASHLFYNILRYSNWCSLKYSFVNFLKIILKSDGARLPIPVVEFKRVRYQSYPMSPTIYLPTRILKGKRIYRPPLMRILKSYQTNISRIVFSQTPDQLENSEVFLLLPEKSAGSCENNSCYDTTAEKCWFLLCLLRFLWIS